MKRKFAYLLGAILISVASCSFITNKKFDNPDKDKLLIDLISYVLKATTALKILMINFLSRFIKII